MTLSHTRTTVLRRKQSQQLTVRQRRRDMTAPGFRLNDAAHRLFEAYLPVFGYPTHAELALELAEVALAVYSNDNREPYRIAQQNLSALRSQKPAREHNLSSFRLPTTTYFEIERYQSAHPELRTVSATVAQLVEVGLALVETYPQFVPPSIAAHVNAQIEKLEPF